MAAIVMLLSRQSYAERVALVRTPKADVVLRDTFNRLRAELNLHLFEVALRDACTTPPCPAVAEVAQAEAAVAVIQLQRVGPLVSAELCVLDRLTGESHLRELTSEVNPDTAVIIAIRTVDHLRERLREPLQRREPPADAVPTPKPVAAKPVPPLQTVTIRPRNSLRVGVLGFATASRISPAFGGDLTFERLVDRRFRVGLEVAQTGFGGSWRDASGTATIRQTAVAVRASYALFEREPFTGSFMAGVGMHYLRASSVVREPLEGQLDTATAWYGALGAELSLNASAHWAVELEPSVMAMTPRPTLAIASREMPFWWLQFRSVIGVRASF